jgi:hypothetical protein
MLQGFYFAKPQDISLIKESQIRDKNKCIADNFKNYTLKKIAREKLWRRNYDKIVKKITAQLRGMSIDKINPRLEEIIAIHAFIECIYVLDQSGIQVSETVFNWGQCAKPQSPFFSPALKGTDHSIKDYYFLLVDMDQEYYRTEPYISLASGNSCVTNSTIFRDAKDNELILCVDILY